MANKAFRLIVIVCLLTACAFQGRAEQAGTAPEAAAIVSLDEAERFAALESLHAGKTTLTEDATTAILTDPRPKNVSTLLFRLMESGSDLVYRLPPPARMTAETATGAFPNIAYYYARIRPREGWGALQRLYSARPDQRMAVCKAMGETGLPEAGAFLIREMNAENADLISLLAGYRLMNAPLPAVQVSALLSRSLNRDELVTLAKTPAGLSESDLKALFTAGDARTRFYAAEAAFFRPEAYLGVIQAIVTDLMRKGDADGARRLMMSDGMRRSRDVRVRGYRDGVLKRLGSL